MTDKPARDPAIRYAQQVLLMVHELHKLGYQRLRIVPGLSPSGCHWRCSLTHAGNILAHHGAQAVDPNRDTVRYTSGQGSAYFGWDDAHGDSPQQLAAKFVERFPEIARLSRGADRAYADWYAGMLKLVKRGILPVAYADWAAEPHPLWLPTTEGLESDLPMPPGGETESDRPA